MTTTLKQRIPEFRAWLKEHECIKDVNSNYWNLNFEKDGSIILKCRGLIDFNDGNGEVDYFDPEEFVLMQYIGQKDKNGKKIYDGDILKINTPKGEAIGLVVYMEEWSHYQVETNLGRYNILGDDDIILGNIFENSELLNN